MTLFAYALSHPGEIFQDTVMPCQGVGMCVCPRLTVDHGSVDVSKLLKEVLNLEQLQRFKSRVNHQNCCAGIKTIEEDAHYIVSCQKLKVK